MGADRLTRQKLEAENQRLRQEIAELKNALDLERRGVAGESSRAEHWNASEQKRAEQALRDKTEELERYFANSLDLLCIADTDGYFHRLNKEWEATLGYSVEELQGKRFLEYVHPEDVEATAQATAQLGAQKEVLNFVNRFRCKDGSYRWIEWRSFPAGKLIYGAARDITERRKAEQDLLASEDRFVSFMRHLPGFAYLKSHDRRILFVSEKFKSDFGIPLADWLGKTNDEIWPGEVGERIKRDDQSVLESGQPLITVETVPTQDGLRTFRTIKFPIPRPEGSPWLGGVSVDITELLEAEGARRKSESITQSIIESIPLGMHIYQLESDGRLVFSGCNPAADRILGVDNTAFIGKSIDEAFPALMATEVPRRYREAAANGTPWHTEQINYHEGSIKGAFDVYAFQIAANRMAAAFDDITARKRTEEALRASEERFKRLVQNSSDIISIVDEHMSLSSISGPVERIVGYRPEELMGRNGVELIHPDDLDAVSKIFAEVVAQTNSTRRVEYRLRHKDGTWIPLEAVGTNLIPDPFVKGIVVNIRDISERNRLQEQLQQAAKMEAVGRLSGGIAHDFNNLLTTIIGNVELTLMQPNLSECLVQSLDEISKAAESAASLTRQLLAFSRRQIIEPRILNVNNLILDIKKMLARLIGEDIELQMVLGAEIGSVRVDPAQFEQVLVNLAVNARDSMPKGGKLSIETRDVDLDERYCARNLQIKPGKFVRISVADTGHGMGEEVKKHIFEPFFTTKAKGQGTGLGLATTFGIINQAGGAIEVRSDPGLGSTFMIYLPSIESPSDELPRKESILDQSGGSETVLLVEDNASVRGMALQMLKRLGYNVLQAADGAEAIKIAENFNWRIDLLLTDVVMPGMNGRDLSELLIRTHPQMKVLFTSGYTEDVIVHHGIVEENLNFIGKPYSMQVLAKKIREVLES